MLKGFSVGIEVENNKEFIWYLGKLLLFVRKFIEIEGWVRSSVIDILLR